MAVSEKVRKAFRWLGFAAFGGLGLWLLKLTLYHGWAAGGPPNPYPEWHLHWFNVFGACAIACAVAAGAILWFGRPRRK